MIAEDSKPILRNIKGLIESSELPLKVVATAANGEEALAAFDAHSIDIMLTDIRMPKMDGLALIERAKRIRPQLKAVLISGYNDFEYTRKAINLQVCDYLMKPVHRGELAEVLEKVLAQLRESEGDAGSDFEEIVGRRYWREIERPPEFYRNPHVWILIGKRPFARIERSPLEAFAAAGLPIPAPYWAMPTVAEDRLLLVADASWPDRYESSAQLLEDVHARLAAVGFPSSLIGSLSPTEWNRIPEKYREASKQLEAKLPAFKPAMLEFDRREPTDPGFEEIDRLSGSFVSMIEQLSKERFLLMLSEQAGKWLRDGIRLAELQRFVRCVAGAFEALMEEGSSDAAWLNDQKDRLFDEASGERFCSELLAWADQSFQRVKSLNRKSGDELFVQIESYLGTNLYSNVSIVDLAHRFHVSTSYISRIMKRYSGQTFVQYYTGLKIKEACRLMETKPEMKVREISDALCFADPHYFSKVFKERVGCRPVEYKASRDEKEG
nr:response regulator [Cohnella zeiphila]